MGGGALPPSPHHGLGPLVQSFWRTKVKVAREDDPPFVRALVERMLRHRLRDNPRQETEPSRLRVWRDGRRSAAS